MAETVPAAPMRVRDGVYTYPVDWEYGGLAVHVVDTGDHVVLFGAGAGDDSDAQVTAIATEHAVDAVVVEHGDMDHYSGVPALREAVPDVTVAFPSGDERTARENDVDPDVLMEPGETYFGVSTIPAPGHTPGNMAYLHEGVLVAGDTVVGSDSRFAAEGDWPGALAVPAARWNDDDRAARRSVGTLLEFDFDVVLVSHGSSVLGDGRREVERLVSTFGEDRPNA